MTTATGYYSIIQYCPDPSRQEAANVGVVLFCPERKFLGVRTTTGNRRLRRFFGLRDIDREQLNAIKLSIQRRLETDRDQFRELADLERFAATRANAMRLTPPKMVTVESPEDDLKRLFHRLVSGRARKDASQVRNALREAFEDETFVPIIRRNIRVTLPAFQRQITVPYGFHNGRFNLIQPVRFDGLAPTAILEQAGKYALAGNLLYNTPDPTLGKLKLIVVGQFASSQVEVARVVGRVLDRNHTKLYRLDEIDTLLELIRTTGTPYRSQESTP